MRIRHTQVCQIELKQGSKGELELLNVYIRREEKLNINDVSFYFKNLGKEQQITLKESEIKEMR